MIRLFTYAALALTVAHSAQALTIAVQICEQKGGANYEEYSGFGYDDGYVGVLHREEDLASKPRYQLLFCDFGQLLDMGENLSESQEYQLDDILHRALVANQSYTLKQIAAAATKSGVPTTVRKINSNNCVCNNWGHATN